MCELARERDNRFVLQFFWKGKFGWGTSDHNVIKLLANYTRAEASQPNVKW